MSIASLDQWSAAHRERAEAALARWVPAGELASGRLLEAMRYSALGGGKRLRALLAYATAEAIGATAELADHAAAAVEMIHAYSLIHDDLPCMDDDELRRGRPTSHIVFGEALAVLSADALHTLGFQLIAGLPERFALPAMRAARELAVACGYPGMVAGQAVDLDYESKPGTEEVLEYIHLHKTAALIRAGSPSTAPTSGR